MENESKLNDTLEYIEKNLDNKISLDDLAKKAHLSKYYYHRLFHQEVGESVTKYISRQRMEKASDELVNTNQPIIDIALKYQYGSQEAFSRAFLRNYGLTPGKYRRKYSSIKSGTVNIITYSSRFMNHAA